MEPWAVALLVLGVLLLIWLIASDTLDSLAVAGRRYPKVRKHAAEEEEKRERLHRMTHRDE